ncbi:MAG: beta-ketoacyl synthase N-terminal-like domain-containing protein [Tepidisphaeraceae bacterium]
MEPVMHFPAAITGIGLVSVLGATAGRTWDALLAGRSISDHARVAGFAGPDRAVPMAAAAAAEALAQAGWSQPDCGKSDSALFVGTSKGSIESWMQVKVPDLHHGDLHQGLSHIDCELSQKLRFGSGPRMTVSSACSSGLHALLRAAMAIELGEARRALIVAVEASVHPLFVSSFQRLGVLAPEGHGCRPFDRTRKGFIISEAAAAVCLESSIDAPARPLARIERWAIGGDGTHLTGGDPAGKALRQMLRRVGCSNLDLIHAHATGTIVSDPVELAAIQSIAGERKGLPSASQPILYSHKGALGHSLGAAGLVSVAINCLCHLHGAVPPNVRSTQPLATEGLHFCSSAVQRPIHRSLAIAAGFGGPLAVVSLVSG